MRFDKTTQTGRERPAPPRHGGLRQRSVKMAERMEDDYVPARKRYLETHKECELKVRGICTRWARDVHHRAGRTGAALTDEAGFVACCRACHSWAETHRDEARAKGWIVRREIREG